MDSSTTTTRRSSVTSQRASRLFLNSVPQHLRGRVLSRREALVDRSDDSPPVPSPLSFVQMLVSSMCGNLDGGVIHLWPVDYGVDACHAWQGLGTDGRLHTNSAKNMKCEDGVFKFTRYAGNLDSSGSGVDKEIGTTCEQDIVVLIRMEAKEGASIFLDGVECDSGDENDASSTSDSVASPLNDGSSGSISQQSRAVGMLMLSSSLFCVV